MTFTYGNIMERCLGLSCEEACRLIFAEEKPFRIVEREIPDEPVPEQETQYADDTDEPEVDEDGKMSIQERTGNISERRGITHSSCCRTGKNRLARGWKNIWSLPTGCRNA